MRVAILATPAQKLACKDLILADYGYVDIVINSKAGSPINDMFRGRHIVLEGEPDAIKTALRQFDGVWVGRGNPMEQRFEIMHIAD